MLTGNYSNQPTAVIYNHQKNVALHHRFPNYSRTYSLITIRYCSTFSVLQVTRYTIGTPHDDGDTLTCRLWGASFERTESSSYDRKVDSRYPSLISSKSSPINSMLYAPWCSIMSVPIPKLQRKRWYISPASQCHGQLGFPHGKRPVSFLSVNPSKSEAGSYRSEQLGLLPFPSTHCHLISTTFPRAPATFHVKG